ncbi:hypothetical protein IFM89_020263 [Coptis chinensis]|uniref:Homeobox domain-containing protein n=1 Tax=Coptis chinensis TaxID=261450 RepID=A0A835LW01_9MAGN|nr:hypothetical protein IFM89_020263 [Coptis chinensis]
MFQNMSEDVCNIHLGLGLGSERMHENESNSVYKRVKPCLNIESLLPSPTSTPSTSFEPSLTLGLSDETYQAMDESIDVHPYASPRSDVSSFCNTRVKSEKDRLGSEEIMELERVCKRVISDEDEEGNTRKKLRLSKEQSSLLEDSFKENTTLNPKQKLALAKQLNLRPRQIEVWFQNRRARTKLKQTEVDCEYLKKCSEALRQENKRLQKELHELKALKVAPPLLMHLPAATLTMCPSCERIGSGGINTSSKVSYTVAKEPQIYNPYTHPSTAC